MPEILNVEQLLERRFRELSTPFRQMLDLTVVEYTPNDVSSLITFPGELFRSNTKPSLSVAEGKGLTEALKGDIEIFTIITKDSKSQTTYSEIDQINVEVISKTKETLKTTITDYKNGHYQVMYTSNEAGEFNVSITVKGEAIKDSPFRLTVTEKTATSLSGTLSQVTFINAKFSGSHSFLFSLCVRQWYSLHIELNLIFMLTSIKAVFSMLSQNPLFLRNVHLIIF